jgi:hypothetical protein
MFYCLLRGRYPVTDIHATIFMNTSWTSKFWLAVRLTNTEPRTYENFNKLTITNLALCLDRLCGLVVRVLGYRSRGLGFDSRRYQIFWEVVGLERGPLSLVIVTEKLLEWKNSGSGSRKSRLTAVGIRCADHMTPTIRKSWDKLRRHAAIAWSVYFACGLKPRSLV